MNPIDWDMADTFEIDVEVRGNTGFALLVYADDVGDEAFIPFSLINPDSEVTPDSDAGDSGELSMIRWKAEKLNWV